MTIADEVMAYMARLLDYTASVSELRDRFPDMIPGSLRSALSRLAKKGILDRVERGIYKVKQIYRMFRHTKRIVETSTKNPQRTWDLDVEATSEGLAPSWKSINEIEKILNPELIDATIEELSRHGFFLIEDRVTFEIKGSEWLDKREVKYNHIHDVEIIVINNVGSRYIYQTDFTVRLKEYE